MALAACIARTDILTHILRSSKEQNRKCLVDTHPFSGRVEGWIKFRIFLLH